MCSVYTVYSDPAGEPKLQMFSDYTRYGKERGGRTHGKEGKVKGHHLESILAMIRKLPIALALTDVYI